MKNAITLLTGDFLLHRLAKPTSNPGMGKELHPILISGFNNSSMI